MKDHEYILNKVLEEVKKNLQLVEGRLISGSVSSIEIYKYNLGIRTALNIIEAYIEQLKKEAE